MNEHTNPNPSDRPHTSKVVTVIVAVYAAAMFAIMGFGIVGPLFAGDDPNDFVGLSQLPSSQGVTRLTGNNAKPFRVEFPVTVPENSTIEAGQWTSAASVGLVLKKRSKVVITARAIVSVSSGNSVLWFGISTNGNIGPKNLQAIASFASWTPISITDTRMLDPGTHTFHLMASASNAAVKFNSRKFSAIVYAEN